MTCNRMIGPHPCCSVVQGDCLELMNALPDGCVDAVITDPPYGIKSDSWMAKQGSQQYGCTAAPKRNYAATAWDDKPCSPEQISEMRRVSKHQEIFGGNYFELPPSRCWLVWDKENGENQFADCELIWTNLDKAVRRISWMWNGMLRKGDEERNGHPTQKPEGVGSGTQQRSVTRFTLYDPARDARDVSGSKLPCTAFYWELSECYPTTETEMAFTTGDRICGQQHMNKTCATASCRKIIGAVGLEFIGIRLAVNGGPRSGEASTSGILNGWRTRLKRERKQKPISTGNSGDQPYRPVPLPIACPCSYKPYPHLLHGFEKERHDRND